MDGYEDDGLSCAISEFNDYVRADSRVDIVALPFRDGVSIITRRYDAQLCSCPCLAVAPTSACGVMH